MAIPQCQGRDMPPRATPPCRGLRVHACGLWLKLKLCAFRHSARRDHRRGPAGPGGIAWRGAFHAGLPTAPARPAHQHTAATSHVRVHCCHLNHLDLDLDLDMCCTTPHRLGRPALASTPHEIRSRLGRAKVCTPNGPGALPYDKYLLRRPVRALS